MLQIAPDLITFWDYFWVEDWWNEAHAFPIHAVR